jgi:hypothetical protein
MPDIQYGWMCPKCNTMYSPVEKTCTRCSPSVRAGYEGTITISGAPWVPEATQARETVSAWRARGFSPRSLILAATDALIEDNEEEDDEV